MRWAALVAIVSGCASDCPEGYVAQRDQCVREAPPHPCEVLPATKIDDDMSAEMVRIDDAQGRCFWIDETEVTAEAYAEWIDEEPDFDDWNATNCVWKTERSDPQRDHGLCDEPISRFDLDPFGAGKPIRCVDFCDAEAYCRVRGKYLCYDGIAAGTTYPRDSTAWRIACTNDSDTALPWGDEADGAQCRTGQAEGGCANASCGPLAVGSFPQCKTRAGVLDMIGNVAEWTFGCNTANPADPTCLVRGGGYDDSDVFCTSQKVIRAKSRLPDLGFRCCADLSVAERALID